MKKKHSIICHNGHLMHFIAGVLIVCMLFADASLYLSYSSDDFLYTNYKTSGNNELSSGLVVVEDHPIETAFADGKFEGRGSDYVNDGTGKHSY